MVYRKWADEVAQEGIWFSRNMAKAKKGMRLHGAVYKGVVLGDLFTDI